MLSSQEIIATCSALLCLGQCRRALHVGEGLSKPREQLPLSFLALWSCGGYQPSLGEPDTMWVY